MIQIHENITPALQREVEAFLQRAGAVVGVCAEHDPRWLAVLRDGLDHRTFMLVARESEAAPIRGYLPLALVASRLFGRFLVSLPYLNQAGVVALDDAARVAMIDAAADLARVHDVRYIELRHAAPSPHDKLGAHRDEKVRMVLDLPADAEALWKQINAKVRNQVRKGDASDLSLRFGGMELLDDFYGVFAINMRDLGTPVYSRRLFASILEQFHGDAELASVTCGGRAVAGALLVHDHRYGGGTQVPSASSLRQFNHTNANMWMYHKLLVRAIESGSARFDFGRSSVDSGTFKFKKQWGARPLPTVWQYHVRRGDINAVRPDTPKYRRRIETWRKLPVWLTRVLGPPIVRGIP